ncbi:MAG: AAA family ATPase [Clostridia bacterium]|nr:AAA family ATPase [Clostridia bacterium]
MVKSLSVEINNIKGINKLKIDMPLEPDVYAITGLNGIGKSTLLSSIACRLVRPINFNFLNNQDYNDASKIVFSNDGICETWTPNKGKWNKDSQENEITLRGFQEGSITKGTRFLHAFDYRFYKKLLNINPTYLRPADDFVSSNLGKILYNDENHYNNLFRVDRATAEKYYRYKGVIYYEKVNETFISQFDLSTGELMLINLLHLINNLLVRTNNREHLNLILIDEVELALHPSAIRRLVPFVKSIAKRYNVAVYFATHSMEIIYALPVENLIYLQYSGEKTIECITPCYPSYICRDIYMHTGYDIVILVEDDLASNIIESYIKKSHFDINKRIQVLPVGGYQNTLSLHQNLLAEKILNDKSHIISILDGDVEETVNNIKTNDGQWQLINKNDILFLPIQSIEKYLKMKLFDNKDYAFMRDFRDRFFKFEDEIDWYKHEYLSNINSKKEQDISMGKSTLDEKAYFANGKNLFGILTEKAISEYKYTKTSFRYGVCEYLIENEDFSIFEKSLKEVLCPLL